MILKELSLNVQKGNSMKTRELVFKAIEKNISVVDILNEGLITAMEDAAVKYKKKEIYIPEMLLIARTMGIGLQILEPILLQEGIKPLGRVVIGTVKGDLHDIGKNLVKMMLKSTGMEVIDLGVDVNDAEFLEKAEEIGADIVCISAMLTTTMSSIKDVINEFEKAGVRDKYIFMVGGTPVSGNFAKQVKADYYTPNAFVAAEVAAKILANKKVNDRSQPV